MKVLKYKRGQIWWYKTGARFDGNTYNEGKPRPVIIMSNDLANAHSNNLLAIPCTTAEKKDMPTHVSFDMNGNSNTALAENLLSISVDRIGDYIGIVDTELLNKLEYSLAIALGLIKFYKPLEVKDNINDNESDIEVSSALDLQDILTKPGRPLKYNKDDMIRFINDYENHNIDFMLSKYELKDKKAVQQKAYIFRKQIRENF